MGTDAHATILPANLRESEPFLIFSRGSLKIRNGGFGKAPALSHPVRSRQTGFSDQRSEYGLPLPFAGIRGRRKHGQGCPCHVGGNESMGKDAHATFFCPRIFANQSRP